MFELSIFSCRMFLIQVSISKSRNVLSNLSVTGTLHELFLAAFAIPFPFLSFPLETKKCVFSVGSGGGKAVCSANVCFQSRCNGCFRCDCGFACFRSSISDSRGAQIDPHELPFLFRKVPCCLSGGTFPLAPWCFSRSCTGFRKQPAARCSRQVPA